MYLTWIKVMLEVDWRVSSSHKSIAPLHILITRYHTSYNCILPGQTRILMGHPAFNSSAQRRSPNKLIVWSNPGRDDDGGRTELKSSIAFFKIPKISKNVWCLEHTWLPLARLFPVSKVCVFLPGAEVAFMITATLYSSSIHQPFINYSTTHSSTSHQLHFLGQTHIPHIIRLIPKRILLEIRLSARFP